VTHFWNEYPRTQNQINKWFHFVWFRFLPFDLSLIIIWVYGLRVNNVSNVMVVLWWLGIPRGSKSGYARPSSHLGRHYHHIWLSRPCLRYQRRRWTDTVRISFWLRVVLQNNYFNIIIGPIFNFYDVSCHLIRRGRGIRIRDHIFGIDHRYFMIILNGVLLYAALVIKIQRTPLNIIEPR